MSYDFFNWSWTYFLFYWKVTRSLVSYDQSSMKNTQSIGLKGHQIIGELRLCFQQLSYSLPYWKVTRSLVSYDVQYLFYHQSESEIERSPDHWWVTTLFLSFRLCSAILKGHQIIGELRLSVLLSVLLIEDWKVTRSLVSYDSAEENPCNWAWLKGHQIIGELRPVKLEIIHIKPPIERSPDHWWVTTWSL